MLLAASADLRAEDRAWYGGAAVGLSNTDIKESFWMDDSVTAPKLDKSGTSYQIYAGYQLHPRFALELGYLRFADTTFTGTSDGTDSIWTSGPISGETKIEGYRLQGVGSLPLKGTGASIYLKGGLFLWDSLAIYSTPINGIHRFNDDGGTLIGGIGAEFQLWRGLHMNGEVQYTVVSLQNRVNAPVVFATLGIRYSLH